MKIGVIADDVTGGTDVAVAYRRAGLKVGICFGTPTVASNVEFDVIVIALKTRTVAPAVARSASVEALTWLREAGATQFYFKYCSTFDSTSDGNIGPVLDALAEALEVDLVVTTPSSPEHSRTQYNGYLFVGGVLLSETHMRHHPLTPMTNSFLPAVLQQQTKTSVTLLDRATVAAGRNAVDSALAALYDEGRRFVLADAINLDDLQTLGAALSTHQLVAGAAGLATALATQHPAAAAKSADVVVDPVADAPTIVLAGSCSARTLEQIDAMLAAGRPAFFLDVVSQPSAKTLAALALEWYDRTSHRGSLIYSSTSPEQLLIIHKALGDRTSSEILEEAMGRIAVGLRNRGVRRFVVAGGETSGSVVRHLSVSGGQVGTEVDPGVPWIYGTDDHPVALLLKSGNFGERDLLLRASEPKPARS